RTTQPSERSVRRMQLGMRSAQLVQQIVDGLVGRLEVATAAPSLCPYEPGVGERAQCRGRVVGADVDRLGELGDSLTGCGVDGIQQPEAYRIGQLTHQLLEAGVLGRSRRRCGHPWTVAHSFSPP